MSKNKIVALEFIFYQKDEAYLRLQDDKGKSFHYLGTDSYMDNINPQSAFKDKPIDMKIHKQHYLEQHTGSKKNKKGNEAIEKNEPPKLNFMETENGEDALVEGIISLWGISNRGTIFKEREVSFEAKKYRPNKMKLALSHDTKVVSLTTQENANSGVKLLAWSTKNLKPLNLPAKLYKNIALKKGKLL